MPKWKLFYHIVWSTAGREPIIGEAEERRLELSIKTTCNRLGVILHGVGFVPDHLHLAVSIPPKVSIAEFVGQVKGASTHAVHHEHGSNRAPPFSWQAEYGVFSFSESAIPKVKDYVLHQKDHHANQSLWPGLERDTDAS